MYFVYNHMFARVGKETLRVPFYLLPQTDVLHIVVGIVREEITAKGGLAHLPRSRDGDDLIVLRAFYYLGR